MQYTLALISALAGIGMAMPQGVTDALTPTGAAPAGCTGTFDSRFEITVAKVTEEKRSIQKRNECGSEGTLVVSLKDGSTLDDQGRTGYIASNYQFQFDAPAQAGALYNSGFSVCEGNVLALGSSKTFYQCRSGDFYNLYDRTWADQCEPVSIIAVPCGSDDTASQGADGQVVGTTVVATTIITALPDGQPQVVTTKVPVPIYSTYVPVSEYTDGQIQVTSATETPSAPPVTSASSHSVPSPTEAPSTFPINSSYTLPIYSSVSLPFPTPISSSLVEVTTTTAVESSSSAPVTTPATTPVTSTTALPSAPASGSSHVAAGSMGALVVGAVVAFLCL
ncbi:hypothetical protein GGS20DRAFT_204716 [Poronia punctata]|nr:hypothetical protein GGS20DRAFT_204716 [Poronia punctata]